MLSFYFITVTVSVLLFAHPSSFTYLFVPTEDPVNFRWILFTAGMGSGLYIYIYIYIYIYHIYIYIYIYIYHIYEIQDRQDPVKGSGWVLFPSTMVEQPIQQMVVGHLCFQERAEQ